MSRDQLGEIPTSISCALNNYSHDVGCKGGVFAVPNGVQVSVCNYNGFSNTLNVLACIDASTLPCNVLEMTSNFCTRFIGEHLYHYYQYRYHPPV